MNNSNPELLIDKIGRYLPFMYPTYDVYQFSIIFIFGFLSYILHATIAVTIIKSWKTSNYLNSSYFKLVVFGSFNDIMDNILFFSYLFTTELSIVAEYLKENGNTFHLVILIVLYTLSKWTYNIQNMNFFFITIIRFSSVFYQSSYYQYIDKNYPYLQIIVIIFSAILPLLGKIYCNLPYNYDHEKEKYFKGGKRGDFTCRYPFNYTKKEYYFMHIALVHSITIISIILTIILTYKYKKVNKTTNKFSFDAIKKRKKEKCMTRYVLIIGIMQLIRLIQDQFYYNEIKINGYDESIRYITSGLRPFISVLWMFINASSIILISKTLRDAVFKNLKLDIVYKKLFKEIIVVQNSNIQTLNPVTKKKIII